MGHGKWSDDGFLDSLRRQGNPLADEAVLRLMAQREVRAVNEIFKTLRADGDPIPADAPEPFREFVEAMRDLPPGVDLDRLSRGGHVFLKHASFARRPRRKTREGRRGGTGTMGSPRERRSRRPSLPGE